MPELNAPRILIVDDNEAIHEDFRKVLLQEQEEVPAAAAAFFGSAKVVETEPQIELSFATQGEQGLRLVERALADKRPFSVAFVDMRMPPGWDGLKTIQEIWKVDPDLQVVICTAYTDHSWKEICDELGHTDQLLIIKKPFDTTEIRQAATALLEKWKLTQISRGQQRNLRRLLTERTSSLREAELTIRERNQHLELAASIANLGHWTYDIAQQKMLWSSNVFQLHGVSEGDFEPGIEEYISLYHLADQDRIRDGLEKALEGESTEFKAATVKPDGTLQHLQTRIVPSSQMNGTPGVLFGITQDVSDFENALLTIKHTALHDPLTELPNRVLFQERLAIALRRSQTSGRGTAIILVDVDNFKEINDTFGHPAGDQALRRLAARLESCTDPGDTIARLGGDEFAVVLPDAALPGHASTFINKLFELMAEPVEVAGHSIPMRISAGIAMAPFDGNESGSLLKNADLALYRAKQEGRARFRFFEIQMDITLRARRKTEAALRRAILENQFELFYQPLIDTSSRQLTGFEALLRWNHPERGLVPPLDFIPVAEESGLIVQIGDWVLRQACADAANWPSDVSVAVNVSAIQFEQDSLLTSVVNALETSGLEPGRLEIEITETVLIHNNEQNLAMLHAIRDLGVRIAMDDFGVGYSSLSYLRNFPFDKLKLDRSFVRDAVDNEDSRAIVNAVAKLGASLGMVTTAEGVEDESHLQLAQSDGYSQLQGFLFGTPMPCGKIEEIWFQENAVEQIEYEMLASAEVGDFQ